MEPENKSNKIILIIVLVIIAGLIFYLEQGKAKHSSNGPTTELSSTTHTKDYEQKAKKFDPAVELVNPDGFINTEPFKLADLIGKKVILLDFWTYSCINCQRTLPYLTELYEKYKDQGLVIVGVHTPEFEFEKNKDNVTAAAKKFGINYPIVQDNEFATWDAYKNRFWPTHYLIDINGLVVDTHIGEGGYAETEEKVKELLKERAEVLGETFVDKGESKVGNVEIQASSPETYFGWSRNQFLANGKPNKDGVQTLTLPKDFELNKLYLAGTWNMSGEYATNEVVGEGMIVYRYKAKNVYFVASSDTGAEIEIYRDGIKLEADKMTDRKEGGIVEIKDARLYTLINETDPGEHTIGIKIKKGKIKAFTFTFG